MINSYGVFDGTTKRPVCCMQVLMCTVVAEQQTYHNYTVRTLVLSVSHA